MPDKFRQVMAARRFKLVAAVNLAALFLLIFGYLTVDQWLEYSLTIIRLLFLGL